MYFTGGSVDYGYPLPIIYEFTFLAGETCATSVDPIPIIDDRISERQESFRISVMQLSLPLGVQTRRSYATINIVDNDSKYLYVSDVSVILMYYNIAARV